MKKECEAILKNLTAHDDNLNQYVDQLYKNGEYTENDLNEIFGQLDNDGLVSCMYADNKVYSITLTYEGKHYFESSEEEIERKDPKLFISHSSKDKEYVEEIVELIRKIGLNDSQIFCTSVPGFGIDINEPIIDTLREQFNKHDLYVLFIHSENYYSSPIALNEMGAAWALKTKATSILLPGFNYSQMKGVFGSEKISIKLDEADARILRNGLNELRNELLSFFNIDGNKAIIWENDRDKFINSINRISSIVPKADEPLSEEETRLLKGAYTENGTIISTQTLTGYSIQAGREVIVNNGNNREKAVIEAALRSLMKKDYIEVAGMKNYDTVYVLTGKAYEYCDREWLNNL